MDPQALPLVDGPVRLRDWTPADLEPLRDWWEPGHEWQRWDGPYFPQPDAERRARRLEALRREMVDDSQPDPRRELCIEFDGAFVGRVSRYWIDERSGWLAGGIDIYDVSCWGRGAGTCALRLWIDYLAASALDWWRVDLRTWSGNKRLVALAGKLGFQEESRIPEARLVDGRRYDALSFGMLRRDWRSAPLL